MMGEAASQQTYKAAIRVLVSSKQHKLAEQGVHAIVAACSMFTDEYNNALDNPQFLEDAFPFIFTPFRYIGYKYKMLGFFQETSMFSIDELSSMFHLPDIAYNRSPVINWLEYKKLAVPHNLKFPKIPTILEERNSAGEEVEVHRQLGGFPVYRDGVILGWNEYRNKKTPIYFDRKDRSRHHYII